MVILLLGMITQLTACSLMNFNKDEDNCIKEDSFGNPDDIDYTMPQKISDEKLEEKLRIITIEQEGITAKHLMYKIGSHAYISNQNIPYISDHYIDLENNTQLISFESIKMTLYMQPKKRRV